jgi:hypothetical protein
VGGIEFAEFNESSSLVDDVLRAVVLGLPRAGSLFVCLASADQEVVIDALGTVVNVMRLNVGADGARLTRH